MTRKRKPIKRHRVRTGNQDRPVHIARFLLLMGILASAALFYVYQHTQIVQVGYNLRQSEKHLNQMLKKNNRLEMRIAKMKSPQYLEKLVDKYHLKLVKPKAKQIVVIRNQENGAQLSAVKKSPLETIR